LDERPDHLAEVLGLPHAPALEDHERERAELVDREAADLLEELGAGDVALLADDGACRELERLVDEDVGLERVATVIAHELADLLDLLRFFGLGHGMHP